MNAAGAAAEVCRKVEHICMAKQQIIDLEGGPQIKKAGW